VGTDVKILRTAWSHASAGFVDSTHRISFNDNGGDGRYREKQLPILGGGQQNNSQLDINFRDFGSAIESESKMIVIS
jgi:hypothetical protein